ncbi:hypothetical protein [Mucilaginibacter sp. L3T2-6]|uniref:hypothetical protein n=1 Tax=Mucilaginibacter sp. L3T2-6 TaxID=3062491 RepID=UPI0026757AE2|nr:hypothetical protein [Mucilaginibacter sp. L3T2-6]MDO3641232.1 hypothetical protein [Mucilaginibacter sp. L3T2-6]MDV6214009.1 hypothetical protein [Mucilaginibacter sp. L3T2-6]
MTANEQEQLTAAFKAAEKERKPWVAFDDQDGKELHAFDLHFFASATEAEKFCDEANGPDIFADQLFNWDHYVFMQARTLTARLGLTELKTIWDDAANIARQMAEQNLYLPAGHSFDDLEKTLASNLVYPVLWQRSIDPLKEIADYHVIGHQHSGGQIYETGHSLRALETFGSLRDARIFMDSAVLFNELSDKGIDYLIIGRYHDQRLELDIEGYALPHSGLTLVTAHHDYNHGHDYYELHSLFEPATIRRYFFAGMSDGKLQLYNDKLEQTTLADSQHAFYPVHFNHDYLTFKNSNTMNESSFDYVKNQLLYLGFGEEIGKPLREKMEQNLAEFTLPHTRKFGQDETSSVLHFSKGDQKDMTFFNRFDVTLKQPGKEDLTQTFFVGQQYNYTLQERYNMMDGRFAYREQPKVEPREVNGETRMVPTGETYLGWKGLNFKESDKYGNFLPKTMFWNHEKELVKYPIKELAEPYDHKRMLASLEKGNKVNATILKDGQEIKGSVAANPRMQRFDFYDNNGQSLIVKQVEKQTLNKTEDVKQEENKELKQDKKEEQHQSTAAEQNSEAKQGKKRGLKVA